MAEGIRELGKQKYRLTPFININFIRLKIKRGRNESLHNDKLVPVFIESLTSLRAKLVVLVQSYSLLNPLRWGWRKFKPHLATTFLLWVTVGLSLSLVLGSCTPGLINANARLMKNQPPNPVKVVRIGHQPHGPPIYLKAKGNLEKRLALLGIAVEWTEFPAGPPIMTALGDNKIDMGYAGVVPPVVAQANNVPFVYIANEPAAPEAIGILVRNDSSIETLSDLKGKKIAATQASAGHYLLIQALIKGGLSLEDVELVNLPPPQAQEAFKQGEVDAWVGWHPFLAQLQESMPVYLLTNPLGLMNDRNFYFATPAFAQAHADIIQIVIAEMRQAGLWAMNYPQEAAEILAKSSNLKVATALTALQSYLYGAQPIQDRAIEDQQRIAETFFRLGLLPKRIWVEDAVWKLRLGN